MSLVVARKTGDQLSIVSDTQLTYQDQESRRLKSAPGNGLIKSIIINSETCLSFAGDVDERLRNTLAKITAITPLEVVIDLLRNCHLESKYKTEFLLCVGKPEPTIHKFKNGDIGSVVSSWLGDQKAFNRFQEAMSGKKKDPPKHKNQPKIPISVGAIGFMNLQLGVYQDMEALFSKMHSAMDEVITDSDITSVGGFKVQTVFKEKFYYVDYQKMYQDSMFYPIQGTFAIGHGAAEQGGYSINFMGGSIDQSVVALHVRQGNFGIVYKRDKTPLLEPTIIKLDEVDFIDHIKEEYKIFARWNTMDRVTKFKNEGLKSFQKQEFGSAAVLFQKAIDGINEKDITLKGVKADLLYHKGVSLLNLRDNVNAMHCFNEALLIDPSIRSKIDHTFRQRRPDPQTK